MNRATQTVPTVPKRTGTLLHMQVWVTIIYIAVIHKIYELVVLFLTEFSDQYILHLKRGFKLIHQELDRFYVERNLHISHCKHYASVLIKQHSSICSVQKTFLFLIGFVLDFSNGSHARDGNFNTLMIDRFMSLQPRPSGTK